jgi:acyl carrier protein
VIDQSHRYPRTWVPALSGTIAAYGSRCHGPHLASVLQEARGKANIHARSRFILLTKVQIVESNTLILRRQLSLLGEYVGPRTPTESKLAELWRDALSMDVVGIADKYEDLGGDSLLAASIFADIETIFRIKIPMYSLVDAPTIERLAQQIDRLRQVVGS